MKIPARKEKKTKPSSILRYSDVAGLHGATRPSYSLGFTIVELLVVIVVIGILSAITVVSYSSITKRSTEAALRSDLNNASTQLSMKQVESGLYPTPTLPSDIKAGGGNSFQYTSDGETYCLTVTSSNSSIPAYHITNSDPITEGPCAGHSGGGGGGAVADGSLLQTITSANCPTSRVRAVDARDNHTYWVQQLADGKCWTLTNLSYAGGGTNTYSDVKALTDGTGGGTDNTVARYYVIPSTVNYTIEPTAPSTSTDGTGQYGYLYNWCAAMGAQTDTSACAGASAPDTLVSVCPAGWRLPTGDGGELGALNIAVNGGSTTTDTGLRTTWLAQWGGSWNGGFVNQGVYAHYWSSTQYSAVNIYELVFNGSFVNPTNLDRPYYGFAVRCVAI